MLPTNRWYRIEGKWLIAFNSFMGYSPRQRRFRLLMRPYEDPSCRSGYTKYPLIEYYNYIGVSCLKIQSSFIETDYKFYRDISVKDAKRIVLNYLIENYHVYN